MALPGHSDLFSGPRSICGHRVGKRFHFSLENACGLGRNGLYHSCGQLIALVRFHVKQVGGGCMDLAHKSSVSCGSQARS